MALNEGKFQQIMDHGHAAAWEKQWDLAADCYRKALEIIPDHPQALINLGMALTETNELKEACECYQKAAQKSPDLPIPYEKLALIYDSLGNKKDAAACAIRAAETYKKQGDFQKAIENWERVIEISPGNLIALTRLAVLYDRQKNINRAIDLYLSITKLLQAAGATEKAVQTVNRCIQIAPNNKSVQIAFKALQEGKSIPALEESVIESASDQEEATLEADEIPKDHILIETPDPIIETRQNAFKKLASLLLEQTPDGTVTRRTPDKRMQLILEKGDDRSLEKLHDTQFSGALSKAVSLHSKSQYDQAAVALENAIGQGLENTAAYYAIGQIWADGGRGEEAIPFLEKAAKNPSYALGAHLILGKTFCKMENRKKAVVEYLKALKLADTQLAEKTDVQALADLYQSVIDDQNQQEDNELSKTLCQNIDELLCQDNWRTKLLNVRSQLATGAKGSTPVPIANLLAGGYTSRFLKSLDKIHEIANHGHIMAALEVAYYAIQEAPTYLPLQALIGELYLKLNMLDEAIQKFTIVANTYSARGEVSQAVELFKRVIQLAPMNIPVRIAMVEKLSEFGLVDETMREYLELADVYYRLAELDMARKTYTDALRIAQESSTAMAWRVKVLHRMADIDMQRLNYRQALRVYEQITTLHPEDEKALSNLMDLNHKLGKPDQAYNALNNYVEYMETRMQSDRIREFLEKKVREKPDLAILRVFLADWYQKTGKLNDAIAQYDAGGNMLLEEGQTALAIETLQKLISLNPPNLEAYKQVLDQIAKK